MWNDVLRSHLGDKVKNTLALETEENGDLDFQNFEHLLNLPFYASDVEIAPHCMLHYN